ncbi:MAG: hypothetical protein ACREJN_18575, partial [Nitrospiraceae bacterium]
MRSRGSQLIALIAAGCAVLLPWYSFAADSGDVRTHAEQSFDQLKQQSMQQDSSRVPSGLSTKIDGRNSYSSDQY